MISSTRCRLDDIDLVVFYPFFTKQFEIESMDKFFHEPAIAILFFLKLFDPMSAIVGRTAFQGKFYNTIGG